MDNPSFLLILPEDLLALTLMGSVRNPLSLDHCPLRILLIHSLINTLRQSAAPEEPITGTQSCSPLTYHPN